MRSIWASALVALCVTGTLIAQASAAPSHQAAVPSGQGAATPGQGAGPGVTRPQPGSTRAPARDRRNPDVKGTAVLRGQVVAADSGTPIRRAQVRLSGVGTRESRLATTDAQGRFEIRELNAGRYTLTASKGGTAWRRRR